jgi:uncharacterized repeat protein (TIGR01451 family)
MAAFFASAGQATAAPIASDPVATTTSLWSSGSLSPLITGQQVTYTASLAPTDNGGTVSFFDGGVPIAGCASLPLTATGQATCVQAYGTAGSHSIVAAYSGDADYVASSSVALDQEVTALPPVPAPALSVVLSPKGATVASGQTAAFTIAIVNTGNVSIESVDVFDPIVPSCEETGSTIPALVSMAPGASAVYSCSLADVGGGFTNVVTVTGTPLSGSSVTASDTAPVSVASPLAPLPVPAAAPVPVASNPAISIVNDPNSQTIEGGGTATFDITVTNTGDLTLSNVTVTDQWSPDCDRSLGTLNVGQSTTFKCRRTHVTVPFENVVVASAEPPTGSTVIASARANVPVTQPLLPPVKTELSIRPSPPSQTVAITVSNRRSASGLLRTTVVYGTAHFTLRIENVGNQSLHGVKVKDPRSPSCDWRIGNLPVGASRTHRCAHDRVQSSFTDVATVSGISPAGKRVAISDHATVRVVAKTTSTVSAGFTGAGLILVVHGPAPRPIRGQRLNAEKQPVPTLVYIASVKVGVLNGTGDVVKHVSVSIADTRGRMWGGDCNHIFPSLGAGATGSYGCVSPKMPDRSFTATVTAIELGEKWPAQFLCNVSGCRVKPGV